jgi:hypothetical protein
LGLELLKDLHFLWGESFRNSFQYQAFSGGFGCLGSDHNAYRLYSFTESTGLVKKRVEGDYPAD